MTITALLIAFIAGVIASIAGGAIGGILVGGKDLGYELAAMMGGFYGPIAGAAGVFIGLCVIAIL